MIQLATTILSLLLSSSAIKVKAPSYKTAEELHARGIISFDITNTGGFSSNCIQMTIFNNSSQIQNVKIEAGRILTSIDPDIQDILIKKDYFISIPSESNYDLSVDGFCCQLRNACPYSDSKYQFGYLSPPEWRSLLRNMSKAKVEQSDMQHAVWILSDSLDISIAHFDLGNFNLRDSLSRISGREIPWYYLEARTHVDTSDGKISVKPFMLKGNLEYSLRSSSIVSFNIRTDKGRFVKSILKNVKPGRGKHNQYFEVNVKDWPKGKYWIGIYANENNLVERYSFDI